jgi:hypothetical protein
VRLSEAVWGCSDREKGLLAPVGQQVLLPHRAASPYPLPPNRTIAPEKQSSDPKIGPRCRGGFQRVFGPVAATRAEKTVRVAVDRWGVERRVSACARGVRHLRMPHSSDCAPTPPLSCGWPSSLPGSHLPGSSLLPGRSFPRRHTACPRLSSTDVQEVGDHLGILNDGALAHHLVAGAWFLNALQRETRLDQRIQPLAQGPGE